MDIINPLLQNWWLTSASLGVFFVSLKSEIFLIFILYWQDIFWQNIFAYLSATYLR